MTRSPAASSARLTRDASRASSLASQRTAALTHRVPTRATWRRAGTTRVRKRRRRRCEVGGASLALLRLGGGLGFSFGLGLAQSTTSHAPPEVTRQDSTDSDGRDRGFGVGQRAADLNLLGQERSKGRFEFTPRGAGLAHFAAFRRRAAAPLMILQAVIAITSSARTATMT